MPLLFGSRSPCKKRTSYPDHCVTSVTDCCETVCVLGFYVNMVAELRTMVPGALSSESVKRAVQRAKSSEIEDETVAEDTVQYVTDRSGDAAEDVGEHENHHRGRGEWSRHHCYDWQRRSEIEREPDYLKFLAEAEKEAVDPDQYLDMNEDGDCGRDEEVCAAPELSETVAAESSGSVTSNLVIRFGSQSSNELLWTESDLEDYMRR